MTKFKVGDKVVVIRGSCLGWTGVVTKVSPQNNAVDVNVDGHIYTWDTLYLNYLPAEDEFILSAPNGDKGVQVSSSNTNLYFYDFDDATQRLAKYESWVRAAKASLIFLADKKIDPKEEKIKSLEDKIKSQPNTRALAEMIYEMTKGNNDSSNP